MKTWIKYSCIVLLAFSQFSCSNWLDIGSEDRIMEKDLFSTKEGFLTALNGVYIDLLDPSLYGSTLTCGTMDVLARYYDCSVDEHVYQDLARFDREEKDKAVESTWTKAWFLINNVNTLLEHCETDRAVLDDASYHIVKGEALALRALLHFELFRIFGPVYSIDSKEKCMPYAHSSELVVLEMETAEQVQDYILKDLKAAELLLEGYDPVITEGTLFSDAENGLPNTMRYRSLRLNYYAVQAYIARLAVYVGNTALAAEYAKKVIKETQEENEWFPFIDRAEALAAEHKDRVYQSEILFGLYQLDRDRLYETTFSNNLSATRVLRPTETYIDWLYDQNVNDIRYEQWELKLNPESMEEEEEGVERNLRYFVKYEDVDDGGAGYRYLLPLMRISEMYLIAAECAGDEGRQYLDRLRIARTSDKTQDGSELMEEIEKEYRREFIGEGQLFWFFKRRNQVEVFAGDETEVIMSKENYLFSLPQAEEDHRGTNY